MDSRCSHAESPIGQGERLQYPDPKNASASQQGSPYLGASLASRPTGEHGEASLQPTLIGDAVARYFAWDGMRSRLPHLAHGDRRRAHRSLRLFGRRDGDRATRRGGPARPRHRYRVLHHQHGHAAAVDRPAGRRTIHARFHRGRLRLRRLDRALTAPRPYAIVGTVGDMFPWKGLLASATEARRFYSLFDPEKPKVRRPINRCRPHPPAPRCRIPTPRTPFHPTHRCRSSPELRATAICDH